jgi:ABC-type branched-subunit amino acid transport system substrate-binding protein
MTWAAVAALLVLAACTGTGRDDAEPTAGPGGSPTAAPTQPPSPDVVVIADPGAPEADGIRLAAEETGLEVSFVDPAGNPEGALRQAVTSGAKAVVVVRAPGAVIRVRPDIEAAAVPVIEIGSDLYSDQALFRYAFQVSIPLTWQARVLAHYLVADRGYARIGIIGDPGLARAALEEEGGVPVEIADAEALLALAGPPRGLSGSQLASPAATLEYADWAPPGTVACAPYTWAGWAEPIPRVSRFRARFLDRFVREPGLPEQDGYDAARVLAEALDRTGGRGGDALVRALESFRDETYASTPVRLGPDDHVFAEQSHLGLFALEPAGARAPGEDLEPLPWRPLMRTFTTNGKRVNLFDRDVRVFFPKWRPPAPRPNYWRSRFGIITRPDDPLH